MPGRCGCCGVVNRNTRELTAPDGTINAPLATVFPSALTLPLFAMQNLTGSRPQGDGHHARHMSY